MSLRDWIASFSIPATATTATKEDERAGSSQLWQVAGSDSAGSDAPKLSQLSQLSQGVGGMATDATARPSRVNFPDKYAILRAGSEWGDLRPCLWCRNLARSGRCLAAWRGELQASRDWGPTFPCCER